MTVEDYRNRYAQYRSDPALQATHAAFPFIVVVGRSRGRQQLRGTSSGGRSAAGAVRAATRSRVQGLLRAHAVAPGRSIPRGALLQLYRPFSYGTLASIFMLDTRQYRTDQPCGDKCSCLARAPRDPERDDPRHGTGKMADGKAPALARWMESGGSTGSCCEARQDARPRTPIFDGQMGRVCRRASHACSIFSARASPPIPSCSRAMFTTTG